ncbi:hypothetical protein [Pseudomonas amygdali]|uniref:hypothetical protein n=1 Tax=Pseudomonas amygdali TaxID=47877 RepID=UPI0006B9F4B6|nr:hypothetical protein [Pseudomonas amygdali]KPB24165.1 Uncharacterized protein AC516_3682 [Pseudomonas amygdali pv. sesami]
MDIWDTDPLNDFVENCLVELEKIDELPSKVNSYKLIRDDRLNIILHTLSHANDVPKRKHIPLGLVYTVENTIKLNGYVGSGELSRISLFNVTTKMLGNNPDTATEAKYKVDKVKYKITESAVKYTVDRIANLPDHWLWPDGISDDISGLQRRIFSGPPPIEIDISLKKSFTSNRACVRLQIGGHDVIIGSFKSEAIASSKGPGYIYYDRCPDKETREKIRASLSFAFGLPLVYLGSSFYQQQGKLVGFEAESPFTVSGRAWDVVPQPFAPITVDESNMLDSSLIQKLSRAFYENYDSMNLRGLLFRLWFAEVSPVHMKAAYYGAIIESIQKSEIKKRSSNISSTIIEKAIYRKAIRTLTRFLMKQSISDDAKNLLLKKIENGNSAPQRVIAERFYNDLGLTLGPLELTAWNKRNDAAHGNEVLPESMVDNIRSTKILRVILGRIFIKIIDAGPQYIDYYTYGHPIRNLSDAIPEVTAS